jgi:hypothetical protein
MNNASDVNERIAGAPLPSAPELRQRSSLTRQGVRFAVLNLKIFKLTRQHH